MDAWIALSPHTVAGMGSTREVRTRSCLWNLNVNHMSFFQSLSSVHVWVD